MSVWKIIGKVALGILSVAAMWALTMILYYTFPGDVGTNARLAMSGAVMIVWFLGLIGVLIGNGALWGIL